MKKTTFLIVGKHAVLEALKNPYRKIDRVFLTEDAQKKLNRENQSLDLFKNTSIFYKSRRELDNLCGRDQTAHQGLVAEAEQLEENQVQAKALRDARTGAAAALQAKIEDIKNSLQQDDSAAMDVDRPKRRAKRSRAPFKGGV